MGFFEEFQKTTDSQYVLITDYIAQLAKEQNSGIDPCRQIRTHKLGRF